MIVATSSFYHSLKDLELEERTEGLQRKVYVVTGLFLNPHRTNNHTPCPHDELLVYLQSKRTQISGIVYCRRTDTPDIFEDLSKTEIIVKKQPVALSLEGRDRVLRYSESIFNCTSQVNWS